MATLQQLRSLFPTGKSDEDVMSLAAKQFGMNVADVANDVGYDAGNGGLTSKRIGISVDRYQSNLYGVGGAAARDVGMPGLGKWMDSGRDDNAVQADVAGQRAKALGGVDDWRDVDGAVSGLNYIGGLAAQSLPYAGEAIVGGLTGGVGFAGTAARMGLTWAAARTAARTAGATVAGYLSAVGDILSNQREENGTERLGMAAAGGVPYSLLNAGLGVEGRLARGALARNSTRVLDDLTGMTGFAARTGATAGRVALGEGLSETGQELINQSFGRMAVNPDQTLFNEEANKRYLDSFVGGAALGGAFGAVGGGRRSQGYQPPPVAPDIETGRPGNLLGGADNNNLIAGDYSQLPLGAPTAFEDGSFDEMMNQKAQLQNAMRYAEQVGDQTGFTRARAALSELAPKLASLEDAFNRTRVADAGQRSLFGEGPSLEEGPNQPRNPALPQPIVDAAGAVVTDRNTAQALSDPSAIRDRDAYLARRQEEASKAEGYKQAAQFGDNMKAKGLNPADKDQATFFRQLDVAVAQGAISADRADELIGQVLSPTPIAPQAIVASIIRPAVKAAADTKKATEQDANKRKVVADSAVLESRAGGISLDGLDSVLEALNTSQAAGQTALRLARAAEIALKKQAGKDAAQAVKDAADAAKLKAAEAAMPPKPPAKPTKPANIINAEAPKVDLSPAPVVQAAAVQGETAPVIGETSAAQPAGTVDAVIRDAGQEAVEPAVEGRGNPDTPVIVKRRRVTKDGVVVGQEAPKASTNTLFTDEERARRAARRATLKPLPRGGKQSGVIYPHILDDLIFEVGYHLERGVRSMAELMKKLVPEFGRGAIPHIRRAYAQQLAKAGYEPTVVVGGVVDFSKLNDQLSDRPGYLRAARAVLGVDDEGHRINALPFAAAAQKYMGTKATGGTNLSATMSQLGITKEVRAKTQLGQDVEVALPDIDLAMDPATLDEIAARPEEAEAIDVQEQEKFDDRGVRLSDEEVEGDKGGFDDALDANTDGLRQNSASSVGGSANNVSANRKGVISNQKWYTEPMAKAEGDITRIPDDVFATMGVKSIKYIDDRNDPIKLIFMDELRRRMVGNRTGIATAVRTAEKKEERNDKSTTSKPSGTVAEDAGDASEAESDGETEAGAEPKYDAKTVIEEEKSDRLNAKEAREQAAAAAAVEARNEAASVELVDPVTGEKRTMVFGDRASALKAVQGKLDILKTLIECLGKS